MRRCNVLPGLQEDLGVIKMKSKTWPLYVPFVSSMIGIFLFFALVSGGSIIFIILSILPALFAFQSSKYLAGRLILISSWKLILGTFVLGLTGYVVFEDIINSELLTALHTMAFMTCFLTTCFQCYYRSKL